MADRRNRQNFWSNAELKAAVDAYLYMLQLEQHRIPFSISEQSEMLRSGPLNRRNEASIRYRMRNISFVMEEMRLPILEAYSAAPQVGKNVATKIKLHLEARGEVLDRIRKTHSQFGQLLGKPKVDDVLVGLEEIRGKITKLEALGAAGIGHNKPPDDMNLAADEVEEVIEAIDDLKARVNSAKADDAQVGNLAKKIASFGMKVFVWSGQRVTDFMKSAAITAGGGFGIWLSGLGEAIVATLRETLRLLF